MGSRKIFRHRSLWIIAGAVGVATCIVDNPYHCWRGALETFRYDDEGRLAAKDRLEEQVRTSRAYDARGRQTLDRVDIGDDGSIEFGKVCVHGELHDKLCFDLPYGGSGRYRVHEVPEGDGRTRVVFDLDDDGRADAFLLRTVDAAGNLLELAKPDKPGEEEGPWARYVYAYDDEGRMVSAAWLSARGGGERREFHHDEGGRLVRQTRASNVDRIVSAVVESVYDAKGGRTDTNRYLNAEGEWTAGSEERFDPEGRLTDRVDGEGRRRLGRSYDGEGRLLREERHNERGCLSVETYAYDARGLLRRTSHDEDCDGRVDGTLRHTPVTNAAGQLVRQCTQVPLGEALRLRALELVFIVGLALSGRTL